MGSAKHFDRARERLGPVEAVCGVPPGGALAGRLASAAVTQEPSAMKLRAGRPIDLQDIAAITGHEVRDVPPRANS